MYLEKGRADLKKKANFTRKALTFNFVNATFIPQLKESSDGVFPVQNNERIEEFSQMTFYFV